MPLVQQAGGMEPVDGLRVRCPCVVGGGAQGRVVRIGLRGAVLLLPGKQDLPGMLLFELCVRGSRVKFRAQARVEHAQLRHGITRACLAFEGAELVPA